MDFLLKLNKTLATDSLDDLKNEHFLSEIAKGQIKFLEVVESIQEILTNKNTNIRERGIDYLSWILSNVPLDLFKFEELNVIVNYYCDCLKGHHNILPVTFKGLLAMLKMDAFSKEHILKVISSLFQNVNCRTQLQHDRFIIYNIFKISIENYLEDLKLMGPDFLFGLITFLEGETDPACLLLIFNYLPQLIKSFEMSQLSEEFFEVLSCYFPIDFNAAAEDNSNITRQDLAESLQLCLTANENFCKQCLPLAFEKLGSTYKSAKIDSYNILLEACKKIKVGDLENYLTELWINIQKDVLYGKEQEICEVALSVLTNVMGLLSKDTGQTEIVSKFLAYIKMSFNTLAIEINKDIFQSMVKLLTATAAQSKLAFIEALKYLKPFYNMQNMTTLAERKIVLSSFLPFLNFFHIHNVTAFTYSEVWSDCESLFKLYFESSKCDNLEAKTLAYIGIHNLIPVFNEDLKHLTFKIIVENMKSNIDIKKSLEFSNLLRDLAQIYNKELKDNLKNCFKISKEQIEPYTLQYLWALSIIADLPFFTHFAVSVLLEVIINTFYYSIGLESLLNACIAAQKNDSIEFFHQIYVELNTLKRLMVWWSNAMNDCNFYMEIKNVQLLSKIIALIVRNQSEKEQQNIVYSTMEFLSSTVYINENSNLMLYNFVVNSAFEKFSVIFLLEGILGSITPKINIPHLRIVQNNLSTIALISTEDSHKLSASRLLASLVNKSNDNMTINFLNQIFEDIFRELESTRNSQLKNNCTILITWVIKGTIMKGSDFDDFFFKWFRLLGRTDIGELIAENFKILMEDDDMYLNLESHCNVKVLYRQRIFGYFSNLLKFYEDSQECYKLNYLSVLIQLLQSMPIHAVQTEISNAVIIVKKSLETGKSKVLLPGLHILNDILKSEEKILENYITSFITILLKLSTFETCMKVRINALNCIWLFGFYPSIFLLPLKNKVIRNLECCLDDKKRLVRKKAVKARCRWYLVGAPGENLLMPR